jgi:hypothetical protein
MLGWGSDSDDERREATQAEVDQAIARLEDSVSTGSCGGKNCD